MCRRGWVFRDEGFFFFFFSSNCLGLFEWWGLLIDFGFAVEVHAEVSIEVERIKEDIWLAFPTPFSYALWCRMGFRSQSIRLDGQ